MRIAAVVAAAMLLVSPAAALAEAWYLMVPDGATFRHSGSYDTAKECEASITERVKRNEDLLDRLQAALNARQAKGETIPVNDVQFMALQAAVRAVLGLPFSRCEVQCVGIRRR